MTLALSAAISRADSVCLLDGEQSALEARLSLIASSRCTIDAAYFAFDDDQVGGSIARALIQASERGVKVRLLIDGYNNLLSSETQSALIDAGVVVREYHPARWVKLHWSGYRMHDKLLVGDCSTMIVGGRNLADQYFGMSEKRNFSDCDVLIVGGAAQHATAYFDRTWGSRDVMPIRAQRGPLRRWLSLQDPPNLWQVGSQIEDDSPSDMLRKCLGLSPKPSHAPLRCADGASSCEPSPACFAVATSNICFLHSVGDGCRACDDITPRLIGLIEQARTSIVMETPYLVLIDEYQQALAAACDRGVTVHIITNALVSTNKIAAQAGYECQKKKLLRMGIRLWEYQGPGVLHAKCWVVDDCAVVGSYNLDSRAALYDTQTAVVIHDASVASSLLESIVRRHQSKSVQPTIEGKVYDPYEIENRPSSARKTLLHAMRIAVPFVKRHL